MQYSIDNNGQKVEATPKTKGKCDICGCDTISKCGNIRIWHWAHVDRKECDPWYEPETQWHRSWKDLIKKEFCEVTIGKHRADIVGNYGNVIELQHSYLPPEEVAERERFYNTMIWMFDAAPFFGNMLFTPKQNYVAFTWYYSKITLSEAKKPIFLHLPCGNIFNAKKMHPRTEGSPTRGWGYFIDWPTFYNRYLSKIAKPEYTALTHPESIKNRTDVEFDSLKLHENMKINGIETHSYQEGGEYYTPEGDQMSYEYWENDRTYGDPMERCKCDLKSYFNNCIYPTKPIKEKRKSSVEDEKNYDSRYPPIHP